MKNSYFINRIKTGKQYFAALDWKKEMMDSLVAAVWFTFLGIILVGMKAKVSYGEASVIFRFDKPFFYLIPPAAFILSFLWRHSLVRKILK